jgi:hypothetical protein
MGNVVGSIVIVVGVIILGMMVRDVVRTTIEVFKNEE